MDDISKAKVTLDNLLNKKDASAQSIVENVSKTVGADVEEEQEKFKRKVEEILNGTYNDFHIFF